MWTIKTTLRNYQLLLKIVIVTAAEMVGAESGTFIEEKSVYWVDNSELVYNEYVNINLDVIIIDPCDLNAFPPGFNKSQEEIEKLRLECTQKYHEAFLLPLAGHCGHKGREIIPMDTGNQTVNVRVYLLVGYGSVYSFSSVGEHEDISKLKSEQMANVTRSQVSWSDIVRMVESKFSDEESYVDFLGLPSLFENSKPSWDSSGRYSLLRSIFESWQDKRDIREDFLEIIGIEDFRKVFGDVSLKPAAHFSCSLDLTWTHLKVWFSLPKINRDLQIFHAKSFDLMETFDDYICILKYNGTQNVVWSTEQNCIVAKDVADPGNLAWSWMNKKAFLTQSNSCIPMSNDNRPYFGVSACYKRRMWKPEDFFGSLMINDTDYIYCKGGFVSFLGEDHLPISCPPFVFIAKFYTLQIFTNYELTTIYNSNRKSITVIPFSISQSVNKMVISAPLNTKAIMMSEIPIKISEKFLLPPAAIAMLIIMGSAILVMILASIVYAFRKFGFTVRTKVNNSVASIKFWRNQIQTI